MQRELSAGWRWYFTLLGALAVLCIAAASVWFAVGQPKAAGPAYLLRDEGGRLALYSADGGEALARYDIYTRLLPEQDVLALQNGVPIASAAELQQRLEDYGL